jgi:DNA mismatch repair ATPase MutS
VNGIPLVLVLLVQWGFVRSVREPVDAALVGSGRSAAELEVLALLLARLEREPLEDGRLTALRAALSGGGAPASARVAELSALVRRLEWAHNQLFALVAFALSWRPLHAVAVDRWRARAGGAVRGWLEAVAELEALSSLAGYAHEHPEDVFPEILDPSPGNGAAAPAPPAVYGEALRHPLLGGAVPNDVLLGGPDGPRVLLVSGSNMSGKSTYLRTVGVNAVLALAGAPVRARSLTLTPLALGATLRIQDSLQAGRSRFYAEIARLKALDDLARGPFPLLFLLDEILHGTNSHDRRIGAEAVIRGLVALGAIGFVTTHDLALTALAGREGEAGALANAHFEDEVKGGEIVFDYRLRPGVVTRSNALDLMRAVGLRV